MLLLLVFAALCVCTKATVAPNAAGVSDEAAVVAALQQFGVAEQSSKLTPPQRVAVGVNANLDLIVSAAPLLHGLAVDVASSVQRVDHETLNSRQQFLEAFAHFFEQGKAAERFVRNETLFAELVEAAQKSDGMFAVGGNAALIAQRVSTMSGMKSEVLLGGIVMERLRGLLGYALDIIGPHEVKNDQIHLIVEYKTGDQLFGIKATRSNRFIVSADTANANLVAAEPFFKRLLTWKPNLIILSGLHLLDGVSERATRRKHLRHVRKLLQEVRAKHPEAPVHFEWASIGNKLLVEDILAFIPEWVDSIGFNEEESWSVYHALHKVSGLEPSLAKTSFSHAPHPADIEQALEFIMSKSPSSVTRLHFHSLGLHMVAVRSNSTSKWPHEAEAVTCGSLFTSLRICGLKNPMELDKNKGKFNLIANPYFTSVGKQMLRFDPFATWDREGLSYYAAPVLVCKKPLHTVGAGDSISATALIRTLSKSKDEQ